jgi:hypothetical protein
VNRNMIFALRTRYKVSKFLTRSYCQWYRPNVFSVRTNPIVGNLVHWLRALADDAGPVVRALPTGGPG